VVVVVVEEDPGRWVVVVVRVGVEVQTGETGSKSLGGAGLCCWCRFGIACRNGVEREERERGGGKAEGKFSQRDFPIFVSRENKSSKTQTHRKKLGWEGRNCFRGKYKDNDDR